MLSQFQQKDVWERWLAAEIRANFFSDRGVHYARLQAVLTWATLLFSGGTFAAVLSQAPGWLKLTLPLIATGVSLASVVMQNQKRYSDCADLHFKWNRLAAAYQALWNDMYQSDAAKRLSDLIEREAEVSRSGMAIPNNPKVMEKWTDHVYEMHAEKAAA